MRSRDAVPGTPTFVSTTTNASGSGGARGRVEQAGVASTSTSTSTSTRRRTSRLERGEDRDVNLAERRAGVALHGEHARHERGDAGIDARRGLFDRRDGAARRVL